MKMLFSLAKMYGLAWVLFFRHPIFQLRLRGQRKDKFLNRVYILSLTMFLSFSVLQSSLIPEEDSYLSFCRFPKIGIFCKSIIFVLPALNSGHKFYSRYFLQQKSLKAIWVKFWSQYETLAENFITEKKTTSNCGGRVCCRILSFYVSKFQNKIVSPQLVHTFA